MNKQGLNAWEMRAAKGLLSPFALQRLFQAARPVVSSAEQWGTGATQSIFRNTDLLGGAYMKQFAPVLRGMREGLMKGAGFKEAVLAGGVDFTRDPEHFLQVVNSITPSEYSFPTFRKYIPGFKQIAAPVDDLFMQAPSWRNAINNRREAIMRRSNNPNVYGSSIPGTKAVFIPNRNSPNMRETLAHEAFHAQNPFIGQSETLARFYGGWRAPRNATMLERMHGGLDSLQEYARGLSRPEFQAHYPTSPLIAHANKLQSGVEKLKSLLPGASQAPPVRSFPKFIPAELPPISVSHTIEAAQPELREMLPSLGKLGLLGLGVGGLGYWMARRQNKQAAARPTKAMGIPDRSDYGDPNSVSPGEILDYFVQRHDAARAGRHYDLRAGDPERGLYSWATKKELPTEPGGRIALYQQPVHAHAYGSFSGEIGHGYGKGQVELQRQGKILITRTTPTAIHFSTAGPGPVVKRYALVKPRTAHDKSWLLVRAGMPGKPVTEKETYKNIDPEQAETILKTLQDNATVQPKIDGALAFVRIAKNRAEILSHRTSKRTGQPIVHTERFFGQIPQVDYPKKWENALLAGEMYGERGGKAIPAQELGGILNAGVARSLQKQKDQDVALRTQLFGVKELGGQPAELPYSQQRELLKEILPLLPEDKFHMAEEANDPESALALFNRIRTGEHPLTQEGVVIHPEEGTPMKTKFRPEYDVHIREIFPGLGKYEGKGAGGFRYSYEPEGPIAGRLGTGLSDELRQELYEHPELYLGRRARVAAHDKFPSGALRVPSLIALHEG